MSGGRGAELRRRIASVDSAEKLIDAMRLVAAARIRLACEYALASRPFSENVASMLGRVLLRLDADGVDVVATAARVRAQSIRVFAPPEPPPVVVSSAAVAGEADAEAIAAAGAAGTDRRVAMEFSDARQVQLLDRLYVALIGVDGGAPTPPLRPGGGRAGGGGEPTPPPKWGFRAGGGVADILAAGGNGAGPFVRDEELQEAAKPRTVTSASNGSSPAASGSSASTGNGTPTSPVRGGEAPPPGTPAPPSGKNVLLIVVSADRGFCGPYNRLILSKVDARIAALREAGPEDTIEALAVGVTALSHLRRVHPNVTVRGAVPLGRSRGTAATAARICDAVLVDFAVGRIDRVEVVYTRFVSLLLNQPAIRTLLPLKPTGVEFPDDEVFSLTSEPGQLTMALIPPHVGASTATMPTTGKRNGRRRTLTRMLREALAAELASRLGAMTAARDNARALGSRLTAEYNRARQATITSELMDIIGGSML
ncbi:hypothetical protein MMPV_004898 [Pyropia vietnamensis]